jgi:hypothetical protein
MIQCMQQQQQLAHSIAVAIAVVVFHGASHHIHTLCIVSRAKRGALYIIMSVSLKIHCVETYTCIVHHANE